MNYGSVVERYINMTSARVKVGRVPEGAPQDAYLFMWRIEGKLPKIAIKPLKKT